MNCNLLNSSTNNLVLNFISKKLISFKCVYGMYVILQESVNIGHPDYEKLQRPQLILPAVASVVNGQRGVCNC